MTPERHRLVAERADEAEIIPRWPPPNWRRRPPATVWDDETIRRVTEASKDAASADDADEQDAEEARGDPPVRPRFL